ncbi:hypothetical protein [Candidatus Ichthyocystis sparus]|uniref:hypothetical protein n=1 Tax=Candidatus Ichthyocystis sparus TaxID=1561004 RepID=UPI000B89E73D|nr:hypothetical protein [Candidatus Ichthyocystis sparus]
MLGVGSADVGEVCEGASGEPVAGSSSSLLGSVGGDIPLTCSAGEVTALSSICCMTVRARESSFSSSSSDDCDEDIGSLRDILRSHSSTYYGNMRDCYSLRRDCNISILGISGTLYRLSSGGESCVQSGECESLCVMLGVAAGLIESSQKLLESIFGKVTFLYHNRERLLCRGYAVCSMRLTQIIREELGEGSASAESSSSSGESDEEVEVTISPEGPKKHSVRLGGSEINVLMSILRNFCSYFCSYVLELVSLLEHIADSGVFASLDEEIRSLINCASEAMLTGEMIVRVAGRTIMCIGSRPLDPIGEESSVGEEEDAAGYIEVRRSYLRREFRRSLASSCTLPAVAEGSD